MGAEADRIPWLIDSLRSRFAVTLGQSDTNASYPSCTLQLERFTELALGPVQGHYPWVRGKSRSAISFAINLKDSEAIIPGQSLALLEAAALLSQQNRVYISIYENGSKDKTRFLLADLGAALEAIGVDGLWIHSSRMLSDFVTQDRIVMLSEIRNLALAPLIPYATIDGGISTLLFINDVITCTSDLLELINQQRQQRASMVMGMDWGAVNRKVRQDEPGYLNEEHSEYNAEDPPQTDVVRLYDIWVARGINDESIHQRWLDGRPFPVYSGWGGMAAFDASLFTHEHLRFRSSTLSGWTGGSSTGALGPWGSLVSNVEYLKADCPGASECEYIARDIWNLRKSQAKIVMAPQVRTTYNLRDWVVMNGIAPATRREGLDSEGMDLIDWTGVKIPESVVCIASRDKNGALLETWSESNHRTRLDPWWRPGSTALGVLD
ncbi:hypothetical protein Q7P37_010310 [Cladosporium fusiforme]